MAQAPLPDRLSFNPLALQHKSWLGPCFCASLMVSSNRGTLCKALLSGRGRRCAGFRVVFAVGTSAASADMLVERFQGFTSEVLMHPVHELMGRQRPIRLDNGPLAVQPARLDGIEPGALHRQPTHQDPDPTSALHRAVMRPNPRLH